MEHDHVDHGSEPTPWWRSPTGLVLLGFLVVAAYFLITEHTAHLLSALPFLLLLVACPLMMRFMHGGHSGHDGHGEQSSPPEDER